MPRDPLPVRPLPDENPVLTAEDAFAELVDDDLDVEQLLDAAPDEEPLKY